MKSVYTLLFTFLIGSFNSYSQQKEVSLYLSHYYNGEEFELDSNYTIDDSITCTISRLEYYLTINSLHSNSGGLVEFGGEFYTAEDSLIPYSGKQVLVNTKKHKYALGIHDITDLSTMGFHIGVPSEINDQDPSIWASNHALAPKEPSMHWGWEAGYRFIAFEAMVDEDSDGIFESVLQYHAVGDILYRSLNHTINTVETEEEIIIYMDVNYEKLFTDINASNGGVFHGEQDQVIALMDNFATNDVFANTENLSIESTTLLNAFSPNPFSNSLQIQIENTSQLKVYSILGNLVYESILNKGTSLINTETLNPGLYIFDLETTNGVSSYKLIKN
tara:strand:+ start:472 stop:1470 length:999 start_codon:yes stop_codon:yes gene_type:complete